ncbi:hypothetical protein D3C71_1570970 [compost metagenome]
MRSRCGSLDKMGAPDSVLDPDNAQLLLPIPSSFCLVFTDPVSTSVTEEGTDGTGSGWKFHFVPTGMIGSSLKG